MSTQPRRELVLTRTSTIRSTAVRWLWQDFVPLGKLTVLAGPAGVGKSTLTAKLAAQVSRGIARGDLMMQPAAVFIASAEDDPDDTIKPRLEAHGADTDRVHLMDMRYVDNAGVATQGFIELPGDMDAIERAVREYDAKLVVLDPVVAYLSPDKSAYREQHVREALGPVRTMAQSTGAAVVVVMHPNKAEGSDPLRRIGNSGAFTALARSVLIFGRDPSAPVVALDDSAVSAVQADEATDLRVLAIAKSNLGSDRPALQFRAEESSFETPERRARIMRLEELGPSSVSADELLSDDDPEERSALAEAKAWLKDLLADGPVPAKQVENAAGEAGHARRTVQRAKTSLKVKSVKVGGDARWQWILPVDPRDLRREQRGDQHRRPPSDGADGDLGHLGAECAHGDKHREHWTAHPGTGRPICPICHPPAIGRPT